MQARNHVIKAQQAVDMHQAYSCRE